MIRSKIWFRCAVVHDPVTPKIVRPAVIGWDAKQRSIDLTIERSFKGDELLRRMKGWITVRTRDVREVVSTHGRWNMLDEWDLGVEYCHKCEVRQNVEICICDNVRGIAACRFPQKIEGSAMPKGYCVA
ncbi:MAG: hypothetical protein QGH39_08050 [Candidatus Thermoplasmatota archaeon]|nr:hypothetical protein [Candidatus Thermoplasmatota archaeon]